MVPAPMVSVTPALIVSVPVTWIREFGGQIVLAARAPLTVVNVGAASIVMEGLAVNPFTAAATSSVPAAVTAGARIEPHPRLICTVLRGKPSKVTRPFNFTGWSAPLRSTVAIGIGKPVGHAAGA